MVRRAAVTVGWALAVLAAFRWWEASPHALGLPAWTLVFVVLYVATAAALQGAAMRSLRHPAVRSAAAWLAIVAVVVIAHALVPMVRIGGQLVPTVFVVIMLDLGLATWVLVRALAMIWRGLARWLVLAALVPYTLVAIWAISVRMPGRSYAGPLPPATSAEIDLADALAHHVRTLATTIGPRNDGHRAALDSAAAYIRRELAAMGWSVEELPFEAGPLRFVNLQATIRGTTRADEIIVVGAHYDTADDTPGADDNASSVAGLLEIARRLAGTHPGRTLRFVFFANEEPPFFNTEWMGSRAYAREAAARRERIVAMLSLETIGYFATGPGSQRYPFPLSLFYPDRGDFIGFVGNPGSSGLVRRTLTTFRRNARFPSEGSAPFGFIPGVGWSDHSSFWQHGYEAIMVTNTATFRNPNYHEPSDTPATLDYDRCARVVEGLVAVVRELATG
jgi:hypothetical protein